MIQIRKTVSREMNDFCLPYCFDAPGAHLWMDVFYTHTSQETQGEGTGYSSRPRGGMIGLDYQWVPTVYTGFAYGYTRDDLNWKQNQGLARIDSYYGTVYAGGASGHYYAQTAIIGALTRYQATRNMYFNSTSFDSYFKHAWHDKGGWEVLSNFETGFWIGGAPSKLRLYASADYVYSYRSPFQESGAGVLDLAVQEYSTNLLRIETGAELLHCLNMRLTQWTPHFTIGAAFEKRFRGKNSQSSFVGQSCVMDVVGLLPQRTLLLLDAGLIGRMFRDHLYFIADYQGEWGSGYSNSTVALELKMEF
jgi:outer membrane autotransporter protein